MVAKLNLSVRHTFLQKIKLYKKQLFVIAPIAILFVFAAYANTYFQQQQDLRSRAASVYNSQRCIITSQENGCPFGQYCSKSETEAGICIEQPTNVLFNQATELKALSTQIANNSLRYLHTTWWNQNYTTNPKNFNVIVMPKEGKFSNTVATGATIRAQAMTAHATALALNGGFYDAQEVTVDSSTALYRTVGLINGLAQQYKSTDGWKFSPFTILVMQYTAFAAKQVWDYLPASTQEIMNNAVASGADHLLTVPPPYYKNADGKILFPGDSKSEENAWVGAFLFLAARLYPDNLNAAKWEEQALNYMIASHATPSQVGTDPRIKGSNLNEDGTVINHDHLAVDYMFAYAEIIQTNQLIAAQSNTGLPSEGTHNFKLVWNAFTQLNFPASSYSPPGGTILRKDAKGNPTANIYYPKGVDAGIEVRFKPVTTATEVFLQNIDTSGYDWAKAFQIYVLNQQSRRPDGRVFSEEEVRTVEFEPFVAVLEAENVFRLAIAISPATITPTQITSKIETILPVGAPPTVTLSSPADESAFTYEASYLPSLQARGNSQTPRLKMAFRIKKNSTGECYTSWIIGTKNIWLYSLPSGYVFKYLFSQSSFPKLYPLAPGTYTWSAKAIDDKGVFSQSNGVRFCDSDGWAPERTIILK
ncbi:hypothetical protein KKG52_00750 [Patescibacteria group bacterium]|nr:hypothetical protein [Patescibacteria group bacterium]